MKTDSIEQTTGPAAGSGNDAVRAIVCRHLAGMVLVPTIDALARRGVLAALRDARASITLTALARSTRSNPGYLRVALRALASSGWLHECGGDDGETFSYTVLPKGRFGLTTGLAFYAEASRFLPVAARIQQVLTGEDPDTWVTPMRRAEEQLREGWRIAVHGNGDLEHMGDEVRLHLDGMVLGPAIAVLARLGVLSIIDAGAVAFERLDPVLECVFDLLAARGLVVRDGSCVELTPSGRALAECSPQYGLVGSYLPALERLEGLLSGDAHTAAGGDLQAAAHEDAVIDSAMNVWARSSIAAASFPVLDAVVRDIFNRAIEQQPLGICDSRCGDGALLEHVYTVITRDTLRGRLLDEHPVLLFASDRDNVARHETKVRLQNAGVRAFHVLRTDGSRPGLIASELERRGVDIHELVHVRSFEHQHRPGALGKGTDRHGRARTTGAFVHRGRTIRPAVVEDSLAGQFRRWRPYIGRFGLLAISLHTIPPDVAAANLDLAAAVAYDAIHGYSDEFLLELQVFLDSARAAGLKPDDRYREELPCSELATLSVTYFTTSKEGEP